MIRVLIVSDVRLYREGLERAFAAAEDIDLVGSASDWTEARETIERFGPMIVLLDIAMRGARTGARQFVQERPHIKIVAFAISEVEQEVLACAEAGIVGYVTRDASLSTLIQTLTAAADGELRCSPRIAAFLLHRISMLTGAREQNPALRRLTRRQTSVLELIEQGLSNKAIARRLGIELPTVKNHVHRILAKLQVTGRAEAAALLRRYQPTQSHITIN